MSCKIVCIGDSITYGFPYGPSQSWAYLGSVGKDHTTVINRGINGDTSYGLLSRFSQDVLRFSPDYTIVTIGTNDIWMGYSLEAYRENISSCYRLIQNTNTIMVIGMPIPSLDPALDDELVKVRRALKEFALNYKLSTLDFATTFRNYPYQKFPDLFCDDVHPSKLGYQLMGEVFEDFLNQISTAGRHP